MPTTKTATGSMMDNKSRRLVKKGRKLMRKLRKHAAKDEDISTLENAEGVLKVFDTMLENDKKTRAAVK